MFDTIECQIGGRIEGIQYKLGLLALLNLILCFLSDMILLNHNWSPNFLEGCQLHFPYEAKHLDCVGLSSSQCVLQHQGSGDFINSLIRKLHVIPIG